MHAIKEVQRQSQIKGLLGLKLRTFVGPALCTIIQNNFYEFFFILI
jgi:hypothetical protein